MIRRNQAPPIERRSPELPQLLRRSDGAMTRELLLAPGRHGLGMTHRSLDADATTTSVCGYCSTGCGLRIHLRDTEAIGLTPQSDYPVNAGMACPKGWEALRVLDSDQRATRPLVRMPDGGVQPVSWHEALTLFTERFKKIQQQHGNDSVAFLSTGQIPCEEMALLGALTKFGMGWIHGDGNTRQCMATAATAYKESFGFDAPPFTYEDFEQSDCLVFIGANPCVAHPILWERVLRNPNSPEIIVIDPRRTETAMAATMHAQLRPKGDLPLLYGITRRLIETGCIDRGFIERSVSGFDQLAEHVSRFTPEYTAETCGVPADAVCRVAEMIGNRSAVSFWWTMGVNQSYEGTRTAQAIINLALITGNIGRPGTGANSITGQCNAMGSRLWSNTTNLLGHRRFESAEDRREVAEILEIDAGRIPDRPGWSYDRIVEGIRCGEIRGLWVIATNPAHSWIDRQNIRRILDRLDFLVVQDMYATTETARCADLLLPAAGWGEKSGTFINSERRYGLTKKVKAAPGEALADFAIFQAVAHYWGVGEMFSRWTDPEAVFGMLQRLSRGCPCDISGIRGYDEIDARGGIQWPWNESDAEAGAPPRVHRRLFEDGRFYHPDGRAKLVTADPTAMPEPPDAEFPILLLSGRGTVSQWHTQTRTSQSPVLRKLYPGNAYIELNPEDARRLMIAAGQKVAVRSRRGRVTVTAVVTAAVQPGQAFMPMHYEETNQLTLAHFDPYSRQPSYKNCAVEVSPIREEKHAAASRFSRVRRAFRSGKSPAKEKS